ncbi:hypothetical protein TRVL_08781 [Trypanosoma vivax]|nr:hypothetical protein TRVL_08781 [Trypanosoma vivax]
MLGAKKYIEPCYSVTVHRAHSEIGEGPATNHSRARAKSTKQTQCEAIPQLQGFQINEVSLVKPTHCLKTVRRVEIKHTVQFTHNPRLRGAPFQDTVPNGTEQRDQMLSISPRQCCRNPCANKIASSSAPMPLNRSSFKHFGQVCLLLTSIHRIVCAEKLQHRLNKITLLRS